MLLQLVFQKKLEASLTNHQTIFELVKKVRN